MNNLSYHIANNPAIHFNNTLNIHDSYHWELTGILTGNLKVALPRL